ncbi:MAG: GTPase Era [Firmicutes bacterium]|nr:GTPase Era [Bacillota bacterium]
MENNFKSGFVSIIGMPNVGKSTLLNKIIGQKIAIVSSKPQTTRNKILAVYTTDKEQIIFTDTPGIHKPKNKLGEYMVNAAAESMEDTDAVVFVTDAEKGFRDAEKAIIESIGKIPAVLVINKIDRVKKEELLPLISKYTELCDFAAVVPISAKHGDGISALIDEIEKFLIEGPAFYDEDTVTDQPERQLAAEIIREKMLWLLDKEIPHGIAISIEKVKEKEKNTEIHAVIYCEKDSHKGIILGKGGEMIKKIGTMAREDIEKMLDKKVYLELWVKVKPNWRNSDFMMKNFGYSNE